MLLRRMPPPVRRALSSEHRRASSCAGCPNRTVRRTTPIPASQPRPERFSREHSPAWEFFVPRFARTLTRMRSLTHTRFREHSPAWSGVEVNVRRGYAQQLVTPNYPAPDEGAHVSLGAPGPPIQGPGARPPSSALTDRTVHVIVLRAVCFGGNLKASERTWALWPGLFLFAVQGTRRHRVDGMPLVIESVRISVTPRHHNILQGVRLCVPQEL